MCLAVIIELLNIHSLVYNNSVILEYIFSHTHNTVIFTLPQSISSLQLASPGVFMSTPGCSEPESLNEYDSIDKRLLREKLNSLIIEEKVSYILPSNKTKRKKENDILHQSRSRSFHTIYCQCYLLSDLIK